MEITNSLLLKHQIGITSSHSFSTAKRMTRSSQFLVGVFEENARLSQWLVFFSSVQRDWFTEQLQWHFLQLHQLELRTSKTYSKRQNLVQNKNIDVQNLENIGTLVFFTRMFFGTMFFGTFFLFFFGFYQRISPSFVSIFFNTMDAKKSQRVPFLHFSALWNCSKISFLQYFLEIF